MTLWLLMRSTGILAVVLLTASAVLGVMATAPHPPGRWPRWLSQSIHRDIALLAVTLVTAHVIVAVLDPHAAVELVDVVLPFRAAYRPLWLGLGTIGVDLLLAIVVTTVLRLRLGARTWRRVHVLAYAVWPVAVLHGLGSGTDAGHPLVTAVTVGCATTLLSTIAWRACLSPMPSGPAR